MLAEERPAVGHQIDLLSLVDQLQELIETSRQLLFTDYVIISSDQLLDLVDAIRSSIPHSVIEAERVLQERHRLMEDAREEAEHLVENAREQSKFMLQEHHIIKAAEMKADRIVNQAQREADEIMQSADEYLQKLFGRFEEEAVRLTAEIRKAAARHA